MKRIIFYAGFLLTLGLTAFSQSADVSRLNQISSTNTLGIKPSLSPSGLLDFSKVRFSNSYSVSFFSGGNTSGSLGLLRSTMFYDFSPKLSMSLNLGLVHNTGAIFGSSTGPRDASIIPGFSLDYHPSEKFRMSVSFQSYKGMYTPYHSRGNYGWSNPAFTE
ncbi:MAG: hypothetical protein SGI97_07385 [candidate division Zixibacteria bacterium]|nr:hypothetical protein [candidate division Zixibacteria bacterium]